MNDELFTVPETLSPYLQWERDNNIKTAYGTAKDGTQIGLQTDEQPWMACQPNSSAMTCVEYFEAVGDYFTGYGQTRDEAISDLCATWDIPVFGAKEVAQ